MLSWPADFVPSREFNNFKMASSSTSLKWKTSWGKFCVFILTILSWLLYFENTSCRHSFYIKGGSLQISFTMLQKWLLNSWEMASESLHTVPFMFSILHSLLFLDFTLTKGLIASQNFLGLFPWTSLHLESKYCLMDFAFNFVDKFRIWRYASQSCFFLPFLKYLFWSIAFLLQAFLSWLFIKGTGSFTGFLFFMGACSSITDDISFWVANSLSKLWKPYFLLADNTLRNQFMGFS